MKKIVLWLALAITLTACDKSETTTADTVEPSMAETEVNVYSYRQSFLIQPLLDTFTEQTGIKTNVVFIKKGLAERLEREADLSPADVVLTVDISRLQELVDKGLTQPVISEVVEANVPEQFRSKEWIGLTTRPRVVFSSKERVGKLGADFDYLDLADEKYRGRICTRSAKHPYNVSLIASMIAHHGMVHTRAWLEGVKDNLARKPQGNDRAQVKAIKEGLCDISLGNAYYLGKMLNDPEQVAWADSVYLNYPGQNEHGTHVNLSGVALAKYAPHKAAALELIEFLTKDASQQMYAEVNYEEPVNPEVNSSELVQSWGEYWTDKLPLSTIASHKQDALMLIDEVKFDLFD